MHFGALIVFAATFAVAAATPGPAMVTVIARTLATGRRANIPFGLGLMAGDILWLAAAVFGVAALASLAHETMVVLKWLGVAYLLYLAWKFWTASAGSDANAPSVSRAPQRPWRGFAGGISMALSNPKTMAFYLALLPNLIDTTAVGVSAFVTLTAIILVIYGAVIATYINAAHKARRLFASPRNVKRLNRGSSVIMLGAAAAVAMRD